MSSYTKIDSFALFQIFLFWRHFLRDWYNENKISSEVKKTFDILTMRISWDNHCFDKRWNSNSFTSMKWTNEMNRFKFFYVDEINKSQRKFNTWIASKNSSNSIRKQTWFTKSSINTFVISFHALHLNKKNAIQEFDSKRKIRIVRHTKIRNIISNVDIWFVKSSSSYFFFIENCISEISFMIFFSKRTYSLMIEFDERKSDDSIRWFSHAWTMYWCFRRQNVSRNVRIDDRMYRVMCDKKTF